MVMSAFEFQSGILNDYCTPWQMPARRTAWYRKAEATFSDDARRRTASCGPLPLSDIPTKVRCEFSPKHTLGHARLRGRLLSCNAKSRSQPVVI
jgi:hypothetical protein